MNSSCKCQQGKCWQGKCMYNEKLSCTIKKGKKVYEPFPKKNLLSFEEPSSEADEGGE
jgi:hypothetical protein